MRVPTGLIDPLEPTGEQLDPLQNLTGRFKAPIPGASRDQPSWNHTPGLSDQFSPPPVQSSPGGIPDDWDKTSFGRNKPAAPPSAIPSSPPRTGGGGIPDDWDKTSFGRGQVASPPPAPPPAPTPPPPPPRVSVSIGMTARPAPGPPPSGAGIRPVPSPPAHPSPPPRQVAPAPRPVA